MYNGQLVHISGVAVGYDYLQDSMGIRVQNSFKLERICEMYQWEETWDDQGNPSYSRGWYDYFIDSAMFKNAGQYGNLAPKMVLEPDVYFNENVKIGAYHMSGNLCDQATKFQELPAEASIMGLANQNLGAQLQASGYSPFFQDGVYLRTNWASHMGTEPEIGDFRVKYVMYPCGPVTVVAKQFHGAIDGLVEFKPWSPDGFEYLIDEQDEGF